jgi:2',3'-cyclic-nucleotide 2'-phosphodiesterase (5'-nucleotidase family)
MYELMPFENELVVLWLRGDTLKKVIDEIAAKGGEGISGIRMTIKNRKPFNVIVAGKPLDNNKLYAIATNDFMAGGNDELFHLANYVKMENTGVKVRDLCIATFRNATRRDKKVEANLDGRIIIEK